MCVRVLFIFFSTTRTRHSSRTRRSLGSRMSFGDLHEGAGARGTGRERVFRMSRLGEAPRRLGSVQSHLWFVHRVCTRRPLSLAPRRTIVSNPPDPPFDVVILDNHRTGGGEGSYAADLKGPDIHHPWERDVAPFSRSPDRTGTCALFSLP